MSQKLSRSVAMPVVYGFLAGWVVAVAWTIVMQQLFIKSNLLVGVVSATVIIAVTLYPALRSVAQAYTIALRYHKTDYIYNLGNGVEAKVARREYEKKARLAAHVWLRGLFLRGSSNLVLVIFFTLWLSGMKLIAAAELTLTVGIAILIAVTVGVAVLLSSAKHSCYDKFGNITIR